MSKTHDALREALYGTGLVQPIVADGRGGNASFLCRQLPGQEANWLKVIDRLLILGEASDGAINMHVCRRYVRREGKMVFGWFVGVETKNAAALVEAAEHIIGVLNEVRVPLQQAPQVPNVGAVPRYDTDKQVMGRIMNQAEIAQQTRARPRAPERMGPDPVPPQHVVPSLRVVAQGVDEKGKRTEITEMPLPHVYKDLNVPNEKGKGAKATVGD